MDKDCSKVKKNIREMYINMTIIRIIKFLSIYYNINSRFPTLNEKIGEFKIGKFFENFKKDFVHEILIGGSPKIYKNEMYEFIKYLSRRHIYNLIQQSPLIENHMTPYDKVKKLYEFMVRNNGEAPKPNDVYEGFKVGEFNVKFINKFINPIKMGLHPEIYFEYQDSITNLITNLNMIKNNITKRDKVSKDEPKDTPKNTPKDTPKKSTVTKRRIIPDNIHPLNRVKMLALFFNSNHRFPTLNEKIGEFKIGKFFENFKKDFILPCSEEKDPIIFTFETNDIIRYLKKRYLYGMIQKVSLHEDYMTPYDKVKKLYEFMVRNNGEAPEPNDVYEGFRVGEFNVKLIDKFFDPILREEFPKIYEDYRHSIMELFKSNISYEWKYTKKYIRKYN